MKQRNNKVKLVTANQSQVFELSHAERILRMEKNGGWKLPEDSPFELTVHGLAVKPNREANKGTGKPASSKKSD